MCVVSGSNSLFHINQHKGCIKLNEWLGFLLSWILGIVCYGMYQTICEIRETKTEYEDNLLLKAQLEAITNKEHKSKFHKHNEELYYEIINIVPSTEITLPRLEKELLKWNENTNGWKFTTKEEFLSEANMVLEDLVLHGVISVSCNSEVIQINPPCAEFLSLRGGDRLRCDIPLGTDLFEYLRDCGVVCNSCKED